jgi:glucose dehydrogenase
MKPSNIAAKVLCCCLLALLVSSKHSAARYRGPNQVALSQPLIVKWRYQTDQTSNLTPAADKTTVFLPLAAGSLIALNASDGKLLWKA